ncbi:crotonase/enoyl-CoA hydratase family protein [Pseudomonas sp.]|uniref:crotonase/enoyl-CoA hydratase family protein n=1 Tax=Pseudomonas sp. TaxID=306 RepID=UPI00261A9B5A|nr:crotonase/enoyl-CoA hydratase family protein [Pseudomonas sp.]
MPVLYDIDGPVARITLNRPERGNSITRETPGELTELIERANLDPAVHVIALAGSGPGFCAGYDLGQALAQPTSSQVPPKECSPLDPAVIRANHRPASAWDPIADYQMMTHNAGASAALFDSAKPVLCKVQGYCIGGGADLAISADLIVIADDAKIGHPPARVWGAPTSGLWAQRLGAMRAKRLLLTGDSLSGRDAVSWGLAIESAPADLLDHRFELLLNRIAQVPISQLVMHKLLINEQVHQQGLHASRLLGTLFDGIARHTPEGYAFAQLAESDGWRAAVRARDEPFGDLGTSTFKGIVNSPHG